MGVGTNCSVECLSPPLYTRTCRYAGPGEDLWGSEGVYGPGSAHRMNVDEVRAQQQKILEG